MALDLPSLVFIAVLVLNAGDCNASGVEGDVSNVAGFRDAGDALSTAYYLDIRERVDHLDDKICNTDKHVSELKEKIASLDTSVGIKIENLGLKFGIEIRDQLAAYMRELKPLLVPERNGGDHVQRKVDTPPCQYAAADVVTDITTTLESLNKTMLEKFESEVLPLHAATSRLDDQLYSLSQKSDVCLRAVLDHRSDNCTEGVTSGLQGAPASAWITILRRMDGRINFTRAWDEYKVGFGDLGAEFWLGLEDIHQLTAVQSYRLRVVLTDFSGEVKFAEYTRFYIRGEAEKYRLHVTGYVAGSTAGDSMKTHNNMDFSTYNMDNDKHESINCAHDYKGGWWYNKCHSCNPTGLYLGGESTSSSGINWHSAYTDYRSFKRLEISIRHV